MKNSADQGGCYPQRLKAEVDNTLWDLQSSSYPKPNSIIALLFIQNISSFIKEFRHYALCFSFRSPNITQPCPQVFSVNGSIICGGLHFWRHFDVIGSIIFGEFHFCRHWFNMAKILSKFGEQQLAMVSYECGFNQSETGKYFEWIIIIIINTFIHVSKLINTCMLFNRRNQEQKRERRNKHNANKRQPSLSLLLRSLLLSHRCCNLFQFTFFV